jgi:peptidoglycan/LPS O-acetylase OafA/YrhL
MRLSPAASSYLDLVRGFAAIAVFAGHLRNLCFADFQDVTQRTALANAVYFATGFGHQAVVVFFVLSGYFVGGSVLRAKKQGTFTWASFASARLSRLLVVLWPALVLVAACDLLGTRLFPDHPLYAGATSFGNVVPVPVLSRLTGPIAMGNAFFVQTIVCPMFGSNGALWSLANEFWYYLAFPLLLEMIRAGRSLAGRALAGFAVVAIGFFVGGEIASYFPMWLAGAGIALLPAHRLRRGTARAGIVLSLAMLGATLVLIRFGRLPYAPDYVVAVCMLLLTASLVHGAADAVAPRPIAWLGAFTARSSYTLYVVHLPIVALLVVATHPTTRWQPTAANLVLGLGIAAAVYAVALIMYWLFEHRTPIVRRRLDGWFGASPASAVKPTGLSS